MSRTPESIAMRETTLERQDLETGLACETWQSARARVALTLMGLRAPNAVHKPTQREMTIARKNGVGFEYASQFPNAASILAEEQERLTAFLDALEETASALQAEEIPHIWIKHRRSYRFYDSNVDVVVAPGDWNRTVKLLQEQDYTGHVMFKEPDKIMFDHPAKRVSVHLHPGVSWNGVPYISSTWLWSNSQPQGNEFRREMSDEIEVLIGVGHALFENYEISLGDLVSFGRVLQERSVNSKKLASVAAANGWGWGFEQVFAQASSLAEVWTNASDNANVPNHFFDYPYRIPPQVLARAYARRIFSNIRTGRLRNALREVYTYPTFYALKRRHDLPGLRRS
jgi:hypothetical protein